MRGSGSGPSRTRSSSALFVDLLLALDAVESLAGQALAVRVALLVAGIALVALGSGLYIGAALGAGPRDSLMIVGARRTGVRIGIVRAVLEIAVAAVGLRARRHGRRRDRRVRASGSAPRSRSRSGRSSGSASPTGAPAAEYDRAR